MYEKAMPTFFGPPALEAHNAGDPSRAFNACFIVALRALSGQREFQRFMDDNNLWQYIKPLLVKMPNISRMLRDLETYDDVEECVDAIIDALTPPPPPPAPEPSDQQDEEEDDKPKQSQPAFNDDEGDDEDDDGAETDSDDGEGHGDGEGTDDGEDDEDAGSCAGGDGDDDGDAADSDDEGDDADGDKEADADGDDRGDEGEDEDKGSHTDTGVADPLSGKDGKDYKTLTDALKMLEATQRKAIYMYKKKKKSVAEIAAELNVSEDDAVDLLRNARRRLNEILNG
jgi:hypothetical protein